MVRNWLGVRWGMLRFRVCARVRGGFRVRGGVRVRGEVRVMGGVRSKRNVGLDDDWVRVVGLGFGV